MENYNDILTHLLNHSENEVVEFKAAKNNYDVDDLGKYFSALSKEANLRDHEFAWIVFGVWDKNVSKRFIQNNVIVSSLCQITTSTTNIVLLG